MELTSAEVAATRFTGTRYVYNRREVDAFLRRVATTLRDHEQELAKVTSRMAALEHALDVAHAARTSRSRSSSERRRALDQAIRVAGAPRSPGTTAITWEGFDPAAWLTWREAMEAEHSAAADLAVAHEDARRLRGSAMALAGEIEAIAATEATRMVADARGEAASEAVRVVGAARQTVSARADDATLRADQQLEEAELAAAAIVAAAAADAAKTTVAADAELVQATREAASMMETAELVATGLTAAAEQEVDALNRRLAQLRTAIRQAEEHLRDVGPDGAAEQAALAGDLIDLEIDGVATLEAAEEEAISVDLTDDSLDLADDGGDDLPVPESASSEEPRGSGFYERRLAGLRDRLGGTGE